MKKTLFILGFIVLVGANVFILSGVIYNRTGKPVTTIELTERELQMPYYKNDENSGLALRLKWRTEDNDHWFNEEKLKELGFKVKTYADNDEYKKYHKVSVPKIVYIVFEYNGRKYKEAVKNAERKLEKEKNALKTGIENNSNDFESAENRLNYVKDCWSRLYPVDASFDLDKLKEKYNKQGSYIIMPGTTKIGYNYRDGKKDVYGYISGLSVEYIHVPIEFRKIFDSLQEKKSPDRWKPMPPRYKVKLTYGKRYEPWIKSVQTFE